MNDMTAVIVPKSDQWNADDFISGPQTFTVQGVSISAGTEQPVSMDVGTPGKVFRPCKSMSRVLVAAWGPDAKQYTGRSFTLYRDPKVKWGGMEVGGIRISHLSHIERDMTMALTETRANRKPFTVRPLKDQPAAAPTTSKSTPASWAQAWRDRLADPGRHRSSAGVGVGSRRKTTPRKTAPARKTRPWSRPLRARCSGQSRRWSRREHCQRPSGCAHFVAGVELTNDMVTVLRRS